MSRCGSCDIYGKKSFGVYCHGNYGVEECADKLQSLASNMQDEINRDKPYKVSPMAYFPKQSVVIPESTQNLLMAEVRYLNDNYEPQKAEGMLQAYALLTGVYLHEAQKVYDKHKFGGGATVDG